MAGAGLTWTKERVDLLTKLWSEGLSASQIAAELGEGVSRNAVISKAHRLGLAHGAPKVASTPRPPKPSRPLEPCPTGETSGQADPALAPTTVNPQPKMKPKEARPERMRLCQPKTLKRPALRWMALCLCRGACRSWTCARGCAAGHLGDPTGADFCYCGAKAVTGLPYCTHHAQVAYQPATERKRLRA
jgi:GcrA cell cycle regulator